MTGNDRAALLARYDAELRGNAPYFDADMKLERDGTVVRLLGATPDAANNSVLYAAPGESAAAAVVDRQVGYFRGLGRDFEWKWHEHDRPAALRELLLARGFEPGEPETVMTLDLAGRPAAPATPAGYEVRPWGEAESLDDLAALQKEVWPDAGLDWLHDSLTRERAARPDAIRFHGVWHGGRLVGVGWTRLNGSFASLFGGSTLAGHRGRGLYRALVAARLEEAARRGADRALTDAGPMSRPLLERLGFEPLTGTVPFLRRF